MSKKEREKKEEKKDHVLEVTVVYIQHTQRTRARAPLRVRAPKGPEVAAVPEVL